MSPATRDLLALVLRDGEEATDVDGAVIVRWRTEQDISTNPVDWARDPRVVVMRAVVPA